MLWRVLSLAETQLIDFTGERVTVPPGRRGLLPPEEALESAAQGLVTILSPDGHAQQKLYEQTKAAQRREASKRRDTKQEPDKDV